MFLLMLRDGGREPAIPIEALNGMDIGRAPDNQCLLSDPNVGRKAARIVVAGGVYYVEDLGSTNRTSIRGGRKLERGEREPLRHGLVIEVGRSSIQVEEVLAPDVPGGNDATDPGDATGLDFAEQTLVGQPGFDRTMVGGAPPSPAPDLDSIHTMVAPASKPAPQAAPPPAAPRPAAPEPPRAPQPKPAPPRPAPQAVPVEPSSPPSGSSTGDFSGVGSGTQSIRPMSGDLGAIGTLITRRARIVIVNEAIRRVDRIEKPVVMVGRESGEVRIDHRAISQPHAMIRFVDATMNFQIEDRKSKNQTFVGGLALNPEVPQLLTPECLVRFGPIEAVFIVDRDSENAEIPAQHYAGAVRYLLAQKQITPEQARAAQEEAKQGERHVGEALMLSGAITARAWTKAFENGKQMASSLPTASGGRGMKLVVLVGLAVLVLALLWFFRAKLGLGGS